MTCEEFLRAVIISLKDVNDQNVSISAFDNLYNNGYWVLNDGDLFGEIIPWEIKFIENNNYHLSYEDSYGGEGQGDEYWTIYKIVIKNSNEIKYVKFDGYYDSWDGVSWYDASSYFVKPKEKIVIYWDIDNSPS